MRYYSQGECVTVRNSGTTAGVVFSLASSFLFGVMYYYSTLLTPLNGIQIYGWRIALTLPFLTLFLIMTRQANEVIAIGKRLTQEPWLWLALPTSSFLVGVQLWLFLWAPVNGYALDVSLGYFLLPLTLVLTGRLLFKERISLLQKVVCAIAGVGVVNELLFAPQVSWPAFVVALGYPFYFALRRILKTSNLGGMWFDLLLSMPVAAWFIVETGRTLPAGTFTATLWWLILGLGVLSAAALGLMVLANHRLSLGVFGLLAYCEPALLVVVALLLGERIERAQWLTYGCVWIAILLLVADGVRNLRLAQHRPIVP